MFNRKILDYVNNTFNKKNNFPLFKSGYTITIFFEIKEGNKKRIQSFRGVVIKKQGNGLIKTFTVRKYSSGIGVERLFPINQPNIIKIDINKKGKVRRSKIYYIRKLKGKKAKIKNQ
ncbi:50S ribosomal protein L19 [Blattabacterium cuenoti]|uniref:50S ribosomal protein L19 n=1 Tax=Blattabacterium cuenoti TaxID=1653831 RepID=UPI00163C395F|nr:50S ribosomal protein L19 [Blattabacterium cuenoti]